MNEDNGVRLYKYNGFGPICDYTEQLLPDKLLAAEFIPPKLGVEYPDRPQSPPPSRVVKRVEVTQGDPAFSGHILTKYNGAISSGAASGVPTPAQAYVPPSARRTGGGAGGSLAERLRREKEYETIGAMKVQPKPAVVIGCAAGSSIVLRTIPGMTPVGATGDTKSKSTKQRERQQMKKQQKEGQEKLRVKVKEEEQAQAATAVTVLVPPVDPEKRAKKVKKLLKQIEELKAKDQSRLDHDQQKKVSIEATLLEELNELGKLQKS